MITARSRLVLLSVAAGIITLALKMGAFLLTGSVGLLSDAAESLVNLTAALFAFAMLTYAGRPPDETHHYGHEKAEYFSSGLEGGLILVAAGGIAYAAVNRLLTPRPLTNLEVGLVITVLASLVNLAVALVLLRHSKKLDSIALEADAHHLLTDVWTSAGVVVGVGLAGYTGIYVLDPIIALLVAANILRVGIDLVRRSVHGLLDRALPESEIAAIREAIAQVGGSHILYHGLRTRKSGARRFVDFHLLLPGDTTVQEAHDLAEEIEREIQRRLPNTQVTIHVEPEEDTLSWDEERVGGLTSYGERHKGEGPSSRQQ